MSILITNTQGENDFQTVLTKIIHRNEKMMILAVSNKELQNAPEKFWDMEEKIVCYGNPEDFSIFNAKAWTHSDDVGEYAIIKFYAESQDWFESTSQ